VNRPYPRFSGFSDTPRNNTIPAATETFRLKRGRALESTRGGRSVHEQTPQPGPLGAEDTRRQRVFDGSRTTLTAPRRPGRGPDPAVLNSSTARAMLTTSAIFTCASCAPRCFRRRAVWPPTPALDRRTRQPRRIRLEDRGRGVGSSTLSSTTTPGHRAAHDLVIVVVGLLDSRRPLMHAATRLAFERVRGHAPERARRARREREQLFTVGRSGAITDAKLPSRAGTQASMTGLIP